MVSHSLDPIQAFLEKKLSILGKDLKRLGRELSTLNQILAALEETDEFKATKRRNELRIIGGPNDPRPKPLAAPNSPCERKKKLESSNRKLSLSTRTER